MQKHVCGVKVFKTVRERTIQKSLQQRETPTARDCLARLHLMSPVRRGRVDDAGNYLMNEIAKWPQTISK